MSDTNPFVGPRPIQVGEPLFGRDTEIRELYNRLQARRIVVLHSPSGAGKSSLVQAGLIPKLEEGKFDVWKAIRVNLDLSRFEGVPPETNRYLLSAMVSLEEELPPTRRRSPATLAGLDFVTYLAGRPRRKGREDRPVVLLFDQFEEVLKVAPQAVQEKRDFFTAVGEALGKESCWALFILREDYLAALAPYRDRIPTQMSTTFRLDFLGLESAKEAARELAKEGGRAFPAVEQLVRDLSTIQVQQPDGSFVAVPGPHVEPVQLQVVCRQLWEKMPEDALSIDEKDIVKYANVSTALSGYYAHEVEKVAHDDVSVERAVREWVGSKLIVKEARSQVRHEMERSAGLSNDLIAELLSGFLVRSESRAGATWYELSHDRLVKPVSQDNQAWEQKNLQPLQVQAKLWESRERDQAQLLNSKALKSAEEWLKTHKVQLTDGEEKFLEESREQRREERASRRKTVLFVVALVIALFFAFLQYLQAKVALKTANDLNSELTRLNSDLTKAKDSKENESKKRMSAEQVSFSVQSAGFATKPGHELEALEFGIAAVGSALENGGPLPVEAVQWLAPAVHASQRPTVLRGHNDVIGAVAFSEDGARVATGCKDGTARIWDSRSGELLREFKKHDDAITGVDFSSDGKRLLTGSYDGTVRLWDITTPVDAPPSYLAFGAPGVKLGCTALSRDGSLVAAGGWNHTVRIWRAKDGKLLSTEKHSGAVSSLAFSEDGKQLVTGSWDSTARLWNISDPSNPASVVLVPPNTTSLGSSSPVYGVALSPDGKIAATGSKDGYTRVWRTADPPDGKLLSALVRGKEPVRAVAFGWGKLPQSQATRRPMSISEGIWVATASEDSSVVLWNTMSPDVPVLTLDEGHGAAKDVAFSPDQSMIATAYSDHSARIWRTLGHRFPVLFVGSPKGLTMAGAAFSPDGARGLTVSGAKVQIWDPDGSAVPREISVNTKSTTAIAMSLDRKWLATGNTDGTTQVWDAGNGTLQAPLVRSHDKAVTAIVFSSDGKYLLVGSADKTATLLSVENGSQKYKLEGEHKEAITSVAFSSNGEVLATGSADQTTKLWNAKDGRKMDFQPSFESSRDDQRRTGVVSSVAFSPDSTQIVTANHDNTARIWSTENGSLRATLSGHTKTINSVCFSPSRATVVTGSDDGTVRLWDATNGTLLVTFEEPSTSFRYVAFSPNGDWIESVGKDGSVRRYPAAVESFLHEACQLLTSYPQLPADPRFAQAKKTCNDHDR